MKLKLSEAIRKGIELHPVQIRGTYYGRTEGFEYGTCALGAAYEGLYGQPPMGYFAQEINNAINNRIRAGKLTRLVSHPILGDRVALEVIIPNLNDNYNWSREQIAHWLESFGC